MKTKTRRKFFILPALLLAAALAPTGLAGCESQPKNALNIEAPPYMRDYLEPAVSQFVQLYPDVEVNAQYFGAIGFEGTDNVSDYYTQIKTSLMSGKGSDVIFGLDGHFDFYKAMKAGAFADLNEFIANDPDFHMEDYQSAVMKAGELQGKQFLMPFSYNLALAATTESILKETGFDAESAAKDWFAFMEAAADYMEKQGQRPPLIGPNQDFDVVREFAGISLIDYETEALRADAIPEAKRMLSLLKECEPFLSKTQIMTNTEEMSTILTKRQAALSLHLAPIGPVYAPHNLQILCLSKERPVLFPLRDTQGKALAFVFLSAGINNASPNKQNAWNFMKILLSAELQERYITAISIPVRIESRNTLLDTAYKTANNPPSSEFDAVFQQYKELISNPDDAFLWGMDGYSKLFEFTDDYFDGKQRLDDTMDTGVMLLERYLSE